MDVSAHRSNQFTRVQVTNGILATNGCDTETVVPRCVYGKESCSPCARPLDGVSCTQRRIYHETLSTAECPFEGVTVSEESVNVTDRGTLRFGLKEHIGVARVQALDRRAFIAGCERRN